jgi:hypothetical protein
MAASAVFGAWCILLLTFVIAIAYLTATEKLSKGPLNIPALTEPLRIVDLTRKVRTRSADPVAQGGFSDVFEGDIEERIIGEGGAMRTVKHKVSHINNRTKSEGPKLTAGGNKASTLLPI